LKNVARVTILGQEYVFKTDADPVEIERIADFVNARIDEVVASGRGADTVGVVVLALMNVAGDYFQLLNGDMGESGDVQGRLEQLLNRVEKALPQK
jgi:cell division protein ZapA